MTYAHKNTLNISIISAIAATVLAASPSEAACTKPSPFIINSTAQIQTAEAIDDLADRLAVYNRQSLSYQACLNKRIKDQNFKAEWRSNLDAYNAETEARTLAWEQYSRLADTHIEIQNGQAEAAAQLQSHKSKMAAENKIKTNQ